MVSTSVQPHNKNFLFTKNATKPNAYWDIVELNVFYEMEGHENDKKDPTKQKVSFNMLLKSGLLIGKYEDVDQKLGFPECSCSDTSAMSPVQRKFVIYVSYKTEFMLLW